MTATAGTPGDGEDAYASLAQAMGLLMRQARLRSRRAAHAVDPELDPSSYPLLIHLYLHPETRVSELATAQCVSKGTMSRQLTRLDGLGIVERRIDPADNRGQLVSLTPTAHATVHRVKQAQAALLRDALAKWAPEDVAHLDRLIRKLMDDMP